MIEALIAVGTGIMVGTLAALVIARLINGYWF